MCDSSQPEGDRPCPSRSVPVPPSSAWRSPPRWRRFRCPARVRRPGQRRHRHPVHAVHPAQRPDRDRARGPRKAPIVAVNLWYHVGSKDEPPGRSGFAHLYEHRCSSPENHRGEFFTPSSRPARPTRTAPPTTTAPISSRTCRPPRWTWRCGWNPTAWATCSAAIDQAALDEQRGVVQNEKRQGENQPYGQLEEVFGTPCTRSAIRTTTP